MNAGGQLILRSEIEKLIKQINSGRVKRWEELQFLYLKENNIRSKNWLMHWRR